MNHRIEYKHLIYNKSNLRTKYQHIFNLIVTKKNSIEELNDICEALMEKCACSIVRDRTVELQKSYSSLLVNLQGKALNPNMPSVECLYNY